MKSQVLLTSLLIIFPSFVFAADEVVLYKKIDKNGNIIFTDKPLPGAKEVKVDTSRNVVETPKLKLLKKPVSAQDKSNQDSIYSVLSIDSPKQGDNVINADGNVTLIVGMTPRLKKNHQLQLQLNGSNYGNAQDSPYFNVKDLPAGEHSATVLVLDKKNQEQLQASSTVNFELTKPSSSKQ